MNLNILELLKTEIIRRVDNILDSLDFMSCSKYTRANEGLATQHFKLIQIIFRQRLLFTSSNFRFNLSRSTFSK